MARYTGHSQGLVSGLTEEEKPGGNHHCDGQTNAKPSEGARGGAAESSASLPRAVGCSPSSDAGKCLELPPHPRPARIKSELPCETLSAFMAPVPWGT